MNKEHLHNIVYKITYSEASCKQTYTAMTLIQKYINALIYFWINVMAVYVCNRQCNSFRSSI